MAQLLRFGDTMGPGESRTARQLCDELPADWTIICNKTIFNDYGDKREIDFVVVGRHGVYVLDEKSWVGRVTADEGHWTLPSGEELPSPVDKVSMSATLVAMEMKRSISALDAYLGRRFFVFGYVLFSSPKASLVGLDGAVRNKVLDMSTAAQMLIGLDASRKGTQGDVEQFRKEIIDWFGLPPALAKMRSAKKPSRRRLIAYLAVMALIVAAVAGTVAVLTAQPDGEKGSVLSWAEARQHVGEAVRVRGPVVGSEAGYKYVFLSIGEPYVKGQSSGFAVWLDFKGLGEGVSDVLAAYPRGSNVTVDGLVSLDADGRPKVIVTSPTSISPH